MAFRDQILTIKAEATSGTLESLAGADALQIGQFTPTVQDFGAAERTVLAPRPGRTKAAIMIERKMTGSIPFEVAGSGTAGTAPGWDKLALAAGFNKAIVAATSATYSLAWPPAATTYSIGTHIDGVRYACAGARVGSFKLSASAGGFLEGMADFMGLYRAPLTEANPTPTFPTQAAPVVFNSAGIGAGTLTLAGVAVCVSEYELEVANGIQFYDHAGCTPAVEIQNRDVTGSITIERPPIATLDVMGNAAASTTGTLTIPFNGGAGNIVTLNHPTIQLGPIELVEINGRPGCKIPFTQITGASASQEFNIVCT